MAQKLIRFGRDKKGRPRSPVLVDIGEDTRIFDKALVWDVYFSFGLNEGLLPSGLSSETEARKVTAKILRELADEIDPPEDN